AAWRYSRTTSARRSSRSDCRQESANMVTSLVPPEQFTELAPAAQQQAGDGLLSLLQPAGDLGHWGAGQVALDDHLALVLGQLLEPFGQPQEQLLPLGLPAGRRLLGREELPQPSGGLGHGTQRLLQVDVPAPGVRLAQLVDERAVEDLLQPRDQLRLGLATEVGQAGVGARQGLLHEVRLVEADPQPWGEVESVGQHAQQRAVALQLPERLGHAPSLRGVDGKKAVMTR